MGMRYSPAKRFDVPGPGRYDSKNIFEKAPSYMIGKSPRDGALVNEKLNRTLPGPGYYDLRASAEGPKWRIGSEERGKVKRVENPGPGAYNTPSTISNLPSYAQTSR